MALFDGPVRLTSRLAVVLLSLLCVAPACRGVIRDGGIDPANLGQGGWLFLMNNATNHLAPNTIAAVTNENSLFKYMKGQGLNYVIVKAGTSGTNYWDTAYSTTRPVFTSNLVDLAHANGLKIFGSNRSWGSNIVGEIWVADYVFQQGADGFIYDAESEWEASVSRPWITNAPAQAWWLCGTVRSNWPNKFIAHNPYDTLYLHVSFPYKEFGYWTDCVMPQVYHHSASQGNAIAAIHWTDFNYKIYQNILPTLPPSIINGQTIYWTNSLKPLCLMRDVYGANFTTRYPPQDVMNFLDYLVADPNCVTAGGYQGSDYFRSELYDTAQWAYMKAATIGSFPGVVNTLVLDDAAASTVGSWTLVKTIDANTNTVLFSGATGTDTNSFGTNYFCKGQGAGTNYLQFTPRIVVPGDYTVYQWHPTRADASASTPHIITWSGGSTTVYANQQTNNGNWSLLGRFNFAAGTAGNLRVTDAIPESGGVAIADGIKLVFAASNTVPAAPSGLHVTAVSSNQINLAWSDNATNETGYIVSRSLSSGGSYVDVTALGAGATSYNDANLAPATTYYYVARSTNSAGPSPYSNEATATTLVAVTSPPGITNQPQSLSLIAGQDATFSVTAGGSPPLSYQWRLNGVNITNALSSSYTRSNAQPTDAGTYLVVVTNLYGALTSSPAALDVSFSLTASAPPGGTVSRSPDQASYSPNSGATLTASPTSGFVFTGWSGDASGSANPLNVLLTTNKAITANFVSTVSDLILDNPDSGVTFNGSWQTGTSSLDKYGADYRFASTVAGGTSNVTYRPTIATPGYYDVYIWYPQGPNRSTNAPWQVVYNGGITNLTVNQTNNGGGWRLIAAARPFWQGTGGYVQVSNDGSPLGAVVLADAVRFAFAGVQDTPPNITTPPADQAVNQGTSALFSVAASGSPLNYQWRFYGTNLPGATDSSFTRLTAQPSDAGPYSVVVSNTAGLAISADVFLTLNTSPSLVINPLSISTNAGANVAISVSATGTAPMTYQWRFNGTGITDATATAYTRSSVEPLDAGSYSLIASNVAGVATSANAVLSVVLPYIDSVQPLSNQGFQLQISGGPGRFAIEATPSFNGWTQLTTLSATGSVFQYLDPDLTQSNRFYRVRGLP